MIMVSMYMHIWLDSCHKVAPKIMGKNANRAQNNRLAYHIFNKKKFCCYSPESRGPTKGLTGLDTTQNDETNGIERRKKTVSSILAYRNYNRNVSNSGNPATPEWTRRPDEWVNFHYFCVTTFITIMKKILVVIIGIICFYLCIWLGCKCTLSACLPAWLPFFPFTIRTALLFSIFLM